MKTRFPAFVVAAAAAFAPVGVSFAQAYPNKPIRILVPAPPGGGTDTVARIVGQKLSAAVGQPVVIDNRAGASGSIAARTTAKAAPDGYTLYVPFASHVTNVSLFKDVGYDPIKDFSAITRLSGLPYLLIVNPALPAKNLKEMIALSKSTKGGLNYASAGAGLTGHLAMELLKDLADFEAVHVAYKGGAAATVDVAGGRVCCFFASAPSALPMVKGGRVRVIAVSTKERSPLVPEVPTVAEQGFAGFDVVSWYGMLAPAGTPASIVSLLHREIVGLLKQEDTTRQLNAVGATPAPSASPEEFRAYLQSELKTWNRVITRAGITAN
ncbi:MAG TPA: tripartite tricarboxylate transporter substrate binding protein [Burkholderiales bacterium]|nr:tripartite tricarboxylate transporter substrate binding protein [Burkholderiales bacterium]